LKTRRRRIDQKGTIRGHRLQKPLRIGQKPNLLCLKHLLKEVYVETEAAEGLLVEVVNEVVAATLLTIVVAGLQNNLSKVIGPKKSKKTKIITTEGDVTTSLKMISRNLQMRHQSPNRDLRLPLFRKRKRMKRGATTAEVEGVVVAKKTFSSKEIRTNARLINKIHAYSMPSNTRIRLRKRVTKAGRTLVVLKIKLFWVLLRL
jgi:hypothetical protein